MTEDGRVEQRTRRRNGGLLDIVTRTTL
jgi:hypothetical protein